MQQVISFKRKFSMLFQFFFLNVRKIINELYLHRILHITIHSINNLKYIALECMPSRMEMNLANDFVKFILVLCFYRF